MTIPSKVTSGLPPRLRWYVLAVVAAGLPVVTWAAVTVAGTHLDPRTAFGIAMFFSFALIAELRPVPIDPAGNRNISLAFVFIIASLLLFGWQWAALIGAAGIGIAMAVDQSGQVKVVFNASTYAVAAGLAGVGGILTGWFIHDRGYGGLVLMAILCGAIFVVVNVVLVCVAIGLATGEPVREILVDHLRHSGPIFTVMVFVAAQAVIFWTLNKWLVLLLSAPLFALTMYQRSHVRSRIAEAEAATDGLTLLKNRRAFDEEATRAMTAVADGGDLTLCLIDIDHFKHVNDRHGHPVGDALLALLARGIEEVAPGRGYRLGGDELAFIVSTSTADTVARVQRIQEYFGLHQLALLPETVTISAGIASFADHGTDGDVHSLVKHADLALYQSKNNGRARSTVYTPRAISPAGEDVLTSAFPLVDIRLVTARRLATLVDALAAASAEEHGFLAAPVYTGVLDRWQSFDGKHSEAVAGISVALGRRLGLSAEELDHVRLAALLHDVGKIAVPENVLNKPGGLSPSERELVERHPVIGYELLRDLGLAPVDLYVRHHHERWDGDGYPDRLAGAAIPFGARLILVADAFDALTSNRSYQNAISIEAAMNELQGEAGRQFDPLVVAALHDYLAELLSVVEPAEAARLEPAWSF
jgi:diguanylate cyclase (GGDEF)-like protein/putative nucleotidyltransferase with HDIG domain